MLNQFVEPITRGMTFVPSTEIFVTEASRRLWYRTLSVYIFPLGKAPDYLSALSGEEQEIV